MDHQIIIEKYMQTVVLPSQATDQLFAIAFTGLPGSGKSTVAQLLSQKLNLYIASNDSIRRFLEKEGLLEQKDSQRLVRAIAWERVRYLFSHHMSFIIDGDIILHLEQAKALAKEYGVRLYVIQVVCPEPVILERINKRLADIATNADVTESRAGLPDYLERKAIHQTHAIDVVDIYCTVDTSTDLTVQIEKFVKKIGADNRQA